MALPYQRGLEDRIADLERQVQQLFSSIQNRQGITSASAGLVIPPRSTPPAPDSGGHIYASGTEPYWMDSSGASYTLKSEPFPIAARTEIVPNMTAGATAPGSYDQNYIERLREDVRATREAVNETINNDRAAGQTF
jgi:hypothetical protein